MREWAVRHQSAHRKAGARHRLVRCEERPRCDKFAACGLHAAPGSVLTDCPVLEESPVNLECRITQRIPLGSHDLFLAEVVA